MKYKLRKDLSLKYLYKTLYRIERLSDGLLGGYVQSENNLSQDGNCFIYDDAKVFDNAQVYGNAEVYGNAQVYGDARVYGSAVVSDNAVIYGNALICGDAIVSGDAVVYGSAKVFGDAKISSSTEILNIIAIPFSITITPDNIVIGCRLRKRSEWLKVTEEEAVEMGLPKELYNHYRTLVKTGMKFVPRRSKK